VRRAAELKTLYIMCGDRPAEIGAVGSNLLAVFLRV